MLLASNRTPPLTALLLSAALCFLVSARLRAQEETTSAITGQVTDASSAAISGATVVIVSIFMESRRRRNPFRSRIHNLSIKCA